MALFRGATELKKFYIGGTEYKKLYRGATEIFSAANVATVTLPAGISVERCEFVQLGIV